MTLRALELGAVDFVPKPDGTVSLSIDRVRGMLVQKVRAAAKARPRRTSGLRQRIRAQRHEVERRAKTRAALGSVARAGVSGLVLVGVSTGGPRTLEEILPELAPATGDIVLLKHRYSAFQRSNLEHLLRARGRDQLMICGVYAHIGCLATAVEAFQRDIEAFAVADAQADFSREKQDMAMGWIAATCGVALPTRQALAALGGQEMKSCA